MGALSVPASGIVYVDAMTVIYTVERYPAYPAYWPPPVYTWPASNLSPTISVSVPFRVSPL